MKYLKLFEDYYGDKLESLLMDMKSLNEGDVISNNILHNFTNALHGFDLNNGFIEDFVLSKPKFTLERLKISEIELGDVSHDLVDEYKSEYSDSSWYPPIIYDKENDLIIDGYHRAKMVDDMGEEFIYAWV